MATPKKKNQTPPAPVVKGRLNVHKFRIDGYIAVDFGDRSTVRASGDGLGPAANTTGLDLCAAHLYARLLRCPLQV